MKQILISIIACCCLITAVVAQPIITTKARVTEAKLYQVGAQLTMSDSDIKLPKGLSLLEIDGLPDSIAESTIQTSLSGSNGVRILSVSKRYDSAKPGRLQLIATKILTAKIEAVEDSLKQMEIKLNALEKQLDALDLYKRMGSDKSLTLDQIRQTGEFVHNQIISLENRQLEITKLTSRLENRQELLITERKVLTNRYGNNHTSIFCLVESEQTTTVAFNVTYYTNSVGWSFRYDLKIPQDLVPSAKLTTGAKIVQMTGLEWKDIKLTLSTSNPNRDSHELPIVSPQYLSFSNINAVSIQTVRKDAKYQEVDIDEDVPYFVEERNQEKVVATMLPTADITQGVNSREYNISIPYSINSGKQDGIQITIEEQEIPVSYEYLAAMDHDGRVILTTIIDSVSRYQFANSAASVYLGGKYLGDQTIRKHNINTNDRLVLSLGEDPLITAKRRELTTTADKGNSSIERHKYLVELQNNRSNSVTVKAIDKYPISTNTDIKVDKINYTTGATVDDRGIVTWLVPIPAKGDAALSLEYNITYPKGREIE